MAISGKCTGRPSFSSLQSQASKVQFEKGTNPRKRVKTRERDRDERGQEKGGDAKINEEERARGGGFEKEGKRPRVISVHRLGLHHTLTRHRGIALLRDVTMAQSVIDQLEVAVNLLTTRSFARSHCSIVTRPRYSPIVSHGVSRDTRDNYYGGGGRVV